MFRKALIIIGAICIAVSIGCGIGLLGSMINIDEDQVFRWIVIAAAIYVAVSILSTKEKKL